MGEGDPAAADLHGRQERQQPGAQRIGGEGGKLLRAVTAFVVPACLQRHLDRHCGVENAQDAPVAAAAPRATPP